MMERRGRQRKRRKARFRAQMNKCKKISHREQPEKEDYGIVPTASIVVLGVFIIPG